MRYFSNFEAHLVARVDICRVTMTIDLCAFSFRALLCIEGQHNSHPCMAFRDWGCLPDGFVSSAYLLPPVCTIHAQQCPQTYHRADGDAASGNKTYVLRSALPAPLRAELVQQPADDALRSFAVTVLALVHMSGEQLEEARLWSLLAGLGLSKEERHAVLGSPTELLKRMEAMRCALKQHSSYCFCRCLCATTSTLACCSLVMLPPFFLNCYGDAFPSAPRLGLQLIAGGWFQRSATRARPAAWKQYTSGARQRMTNLAKRRLWALSTASLSTRSSSAQQWPAMTMTNRQ